LPFQLAADSRFAGRYLEQITDNLARFGLDRVVLSTLNRKPWQLHPPDKRRWYLAGLKQARVRVAALMTTACAPELARTLLKEARTDTLVVPATCDIASIADLAASGVKVLVENTLNTSASMLKLFDSLPAKTARNVRLAFNPLHFARVGENPFLHTYHTKIKRHIGALIVNDGLATGQRTELEQGLGEIKELISILHSRSFDGTFVVQAPDDASFNTSMERFMAMFQELAL
jgi:sugar phosphate isomerase/epimerase